MPLTYSLPTIASIGLVRVNLLCQNASHTSHYTTILINTKFFFILSQIRLPVRHVPEDVILRQQFLTRGSQKWEHTLRYSE